MEFALLYITTSNKEEAEKIGRILVEKRLCACVNIIDGMRSIYFWEGKIENSSEAILLVKTRKELVKKAAALVKAIHSYSVPCILSFSINEVNSEYAKWLIENTLSPQT